MTHPPHDYASWRRCITEDCGLSLTLSYINERLQALADKNQPATAQFIALYGEAHWQNVQSWFAQAKRELKS
jgi:hypothetical protein